MTILGKSSFFRICTTKNQEPYGVYLVIDTFVHVTTDT